MQSVSPALDTALLQPGLYPRPQIIMHLSNNRAFIATVSSNNQINDDNIVDGIYEIPQKYAYTDISRCDNGERVWPSDASDLDSVPWISSTSAPATITVTYPQQVNCNKIVVVSDWYHIITSMTVEFNNGSWRTVASGFSASGMKTEFYLQSSDGLNWGTTPNRQFITSMSAIRITINSITNPGKPTLLEFDAAIEADISDDVLSWNVKKERDLTSISLSPIGLSSANSFSMTLDNSSNKYNNEHDFSPYKRLLLPDSRFDISIGFRLADLSYEYVKQGVFYADEITISNDTSTVSINGRDYSKKLQETLIPPLLYIDTLIQDIVKDVVERAGVVDYEIDDSIFDLPDLAEGEIADYTDIETLVCVPRKLTIWSSKDQTYWQFLQEIAFADMAVFYFDENGKFIFRVKETLTDISRPEMQVVKFLTANDYLQDATYSTELVKNFFKLEYSVPKVSKKTVGLWEAENPTVLSAASLSGGIGPGNTEIPTNNNLNQDAWPREGYIKIDDEVIKYQSRGVNNFKDCVRGWLGTTPASHSGATIYEVRKFDIEYSVAPATNFRYWLTNEPYLEILSMTFTPESAEIYLQNQSNGFALVQGSYIEKALDGLQEIFAIYGKAIERGDTQTIERFDAISIKKFGRQEFSMNLQWVQSKAHAQQILEYLVTLYSEPVYFIDTSIFSLPQLQLGDTVLVVWDRLGGLSNNSFHIVSIDIGQNGADFRQTLRLRKKFGAGSVM